MPLAGPNAARHLWAFVLWAIFVAMGMLTAWRAMQLGTTKRQDWMSGGIFMVHLVSFLVLLFNVWGIGTGK